MAKFNLEKIREKLFRKKEKGPDEEKKPGLISQIKQAARDKKGAEEYIFLLAAAVIDAGDEILDEMGEMGQDGSGFIFEVCADLVAAVDKILDIIDWILTKTFVLVFRKIHDARMKLQEDRR